MLPEKILLDGKELTLCSDSELRLAWGDVVNTAEDVADACIAELRFRRSARAAGRFQDRTRKAGAKS